MNKNDRALLMALGPCADALAWIKSAKVKTLAEAWGICKRSDWMLWTLDRIGLRDDRKLRLYACACVCGTPLADGRTLWDLLTDNRSRNAVEVAERYAGGKASDEELAAAWAAARAAARDAACDAAWAARDAAWDWQAILLRQWISWDEIERAIVAYKEAHKGGSTKRWPTWIGRTKNLWSFGANCNANPRRLTI